MADEPEVTTTTGAAGGTSPPPGLPEVVAEVDEVGLKVAVVRAALELDLLTTVSRGADSVALLAERAGCSVRGTAVLVRALVALGLLAWDQGRLVCTDGGGAYLSRDGAAYAAPIYLGWLRNRDRLVEAVRTGLGPTDHAADEAGEEWRAYAAPELVRWPSEVPEIQAVFADRGVAVPDGGCVLDIGCGSGIVGMALARDVPGATVVSVDRPEVLAVAGELAAAMGMDGRVALVPGDADSLSLAPDSVDVALLVNVAQYLDDGRLTAALTGVRSALRPGGVCYLACVVVDDSGSGDWPMNWSSAVEMYLNSSVDSRTPDQVAGLLANAGFTTVTRLDPARFVASD